MATKELGFSTACPKETSQMFLHLQPTHLCSPDADKIKMGTLSRRKKTKMLTYAGIQTKTGMMAFLPLCFCKTKRCLTTFNRAKKGIVVSVGPVLSQNQQSSIQTSNTKTSMCCSVIYRVSESFFVLEAQISVLYTKK